MMIEIGPELSKHLPVMGFFVMLCVTWLMTR